MTEARDTSKEFLSDNQSDLTLSEFAEARSDENFLQVNIMCMKTRYSGKSQSGN